VEGLARGFDAVLLALGEISTAEAAGLGLPVSGKLVQCDPNTCQLPLPKAFATGSMIRPQKQLVKAMAEGRAAAECVNRFLREQPVRRPDEGLEFRGIQAAHEAGKGFLRSANGSASVSPCDRCAGHTRAEAALESSRCLHCDCASSGNCVLQHYAQTYGADANRFRSERRKFEQHAQSGRIVFEPGKCIRCGICVKLTELAAEPLGLTFVGRGFDVRVAAPFDRAIHEGLQKVAAECVEHCPTGALVMSEATAPA
jgi:ferredoxin